MSLILKHEPFSFSVQAIDDDCNQTAQMTAALLDWPQVSTFKIVLS